VIRLLIKRTAKRTIVRLGRVNSMPKKNILDLLRGGDLRSLGRANAAAASVSKNSRLFPGLMRGLWSEDPVVRSRAADAIEKITRDKPALLAPYKSELLGLMPEIQQQEVRWHLALMAPRLALSPAERKLAISFLYDYLHDRSSIVRTHALQGLADFARSDDALRPRVIELLRQTARIGSAAVKARSRKLLLILDRS